jgi:hypothetical protein
MSCSLVHIYQYFGMMVMKLIKLDVNFEVTLQAVLRASS